MKTYEWIVPTLQCPNCKEVEKGIRIIWAVDHKDIVNFGILCTTCHTVVLDAMLSKDFWEQMRGIPPTETTN